MYFIYSILMVFAALLLAPYWLAQALRHGKYLSNLKERLGISFPALAKLAAHPTGAIWIHAVSVGEALSGIALARRLKETYPNRPLIISTTTNTGQALARERMPFADAVIYFPLDWAFCVRRALDAVRPSVVLVLETEIWPNFLREAGRRGIPVLLVSGRISDRSFARYQRYLGIFGFFLRPFLRNALSNASAFLMQSEKDAERVRALGGTLQGEYPKALLVLAPRKPECFDEAAEFIDESHRKFIRRSRLPIPVPASKQSDGNSDAARIPDDVTVLLLDSIGELASLYGLADGAFVGGSLVSSGGHNILEPAAFGKIPVFGPSMENFTEIASRFVSAGAAIQVESPEDVGVAWIELFRDPERMKKMSEAARHLVADSRGATDRVVAEIAQRLDGAGR